jgi:hypothetical protein
VKDSSQNAGLFAGNAGQFTGNEGVSTGHCPGALRPLNVSESSW